MPATYVHRLAGFSSIGVHAGIILFFFNDTATTEIYTLSLHDALPIFAAGVDAQHPPAPAGPPAGGQDRKSTRLNSSHVRISYAVFCLKKKKKNPLLYMLAVSRRSLFHPAL